MSIHTDTPKDIQLIKQDGIPSFVVIPYNEYLRFFPVIDKQTIPHEVVGLVIKKGFNLIKAWRCHLKKTQTEVAQKAEITQAALSQMEKSETKLRPATLKKIADALGLSIDQLKG